MLKLKNSAATLQNLSFLKTFGSSRRVPFGTLWGPWKFLHGPRVAGPEIRARNVYVEHSFSEFQLFDGRIGSPESRSRDLWKSGIQPDLHLKILQITFIYKRFPTFCVVRGDPRVVSERMSYQVWLATPGSYQVWLAALGRFRQADHPPGRPRPLE